MSSAFFAATKSAARTLFHVTSVFEASNHAQTMPVARKSSHKGWTPLTTPPAEPGKDSKADRAYIEYLLTLPLYTTDTWSNLLPYLVSASTAQLRKVAQANPGTFKGYGQVPKINALRSLFTEVITARLQGDQDLVGEDELRPQGDAAGTGAQGNGGHPGVSLPAPQALSQPEAQPALESYLKLLLLWVSRRSTPWTATTRA